MMSSTKDDLVECLLSTSTGAAEVEAFVRQENAYPRRSESGVSSRPQENDRLVNNGEGPLIIPLENQLEDEIPDAAGNHPQLENLAWILHEWRKRRLIVLFPPLVIVALSLLPKWPSLTFLLCSFILDIVHLILLWVAVVVLPLDPYPGVQRDDLVLFSIVLVVQAVLYAVYLDRYHERYFIFRRFLFFFVVGGSLLWLAITFHLKSYVFCHHEKRQRAFLIIMAIVSPWTIFILHFSPFLFITVALVLLVRNESALSSVCRCLPLIKQLEADAYEKDHDMEEETKAKLERQIAQLGRPEPRSSRASAHPRHEWAARIAVFLSLWTVCFLFVFIV